MKRKSLAALALVVLVAAVVALRTAGPDALGPALSARELARMTAPYPKGTWRLSGQELGDVAFTLSHILVLYRESDGTAANFRAPGWLPSPPVARSRGDARVLAARLAHALHARPALFEQYAREYSEDVVTKGSAGSLGTWSAAVVPPEMLDALGTMRPGEVSRVVETKFGFHVLKLRLTPKPEWVAARRVLIGYRNTAPTLWRTGRTIQRTREEALALAHDLTRRARLKPDTFASLVEHYTDHSDALRGGDFGVISTLRSGMRNIEVEAISQLQIAEISEPIDSCEGFNVFIRDPVSERPLIAWQQIIPALAKAPSERPQSAAQLREASEHMLAQVRAEPARFAEFQKAYCCDDMQQALRGQGVPAIEAALADLPIGQVAARLVEIGPGDLRIVRRVEPRAQVELQHSVSATLPTRTEPDLQFMVEHATSGPVLAQHYLTLHARAAAAAALGLDPRGAARLTEIAQRLAGRLGEAPVDQRWAAVGEALGAIRSELGDAVEKTYRTQIMEELTRGLM